MNLLIFPSLLLFSLSLTPQISAQISQTLTPPPPPPPPLYGAKNLPFRPILVVGFITTISSITFLLLLCIKNCTRRSSDAGGGSGGGSPASVFNFRKNSGVDRTVIESLPVFRFGSRRGRRLVNGVNGVDCSVCLNGFTESEVLRLLPKCKHAFHVECVDTWLDAHSTCPLCRVRVDPEDIVLVTREMNSSSTSSPVKNITASENVTVTASFLNKRLSFDSWHFYREKKLERKDGMLMLKESKKLLELEHRIKISGDELAGGAQCRWSDVAGCDRLGLRSEMILSEGIRYCKGSGRGVINGRSVSEMSGISRF